VPEGLPVLPCLEGEPLVLDLLPQKLNTVEFGGAGREKVEEKPLLLSGGSARLMSRLEVCRGRCRGRRRQAGSGCWRGLQRPP